jgi:ABC-type multidrug transport system ATPase subunit
MDSLGFPHDWLWKPILASSIFIPAFFLGAWAVLAFWRVDISVAKARKNNEDMAVGKAVELARSTQEVRHVTIGLNEYSLEARRRKFRHTSTKTILHALTTKFEPGKINVIMGPSGCGKTSLLQSLAGRLNSTFISKYHSTGNMTLNGAIPSADVIKSVTSFVTQDDDTLLSSLTVRETLHFAAGLRLPSWMSKQEKHRRAGEVILKMGLKDCADNLIGGEFKKGISGGEKRRVSIAIQILTDPKVLLLDEPTSGLDVFTATSVIDVVKNLAEEGRTVVMTVHQARTDVFKDFHNVLLLARGGSAVYSGPGKDMLPYFESLGHICPRNTNPSDYVLDLITVDLQHQDKEDTSRKRVQHLIHSWETAHEPLAIATSTIATPAELSTLKRQTNPITTTLPLIFHRSALNLYRNPDLMISRAFQVIGITIIFTLFFAPLQHNYEAVQSRMGFVQEAAALYFVGMLQNIAVYPMERDLFYREFADACYSSTTFLLSYTALELPFTIFSSLIYGALAAFAIGAKRTVSFFLIASLNCFCIVCCGESIGIMFCTLFSTHVGFSLNITSILLTISTIMGGVISLEIPAVLQAFNHLSPLKYSVANLAAYSMRGQIFSCRPEQQVDGRCPLSTGEEVLALYNLEIDAGMNLLALGVTTVVYRIVAFALLWLAKMPFDLKATKARTGSRFELPEPKAVWQRLWTDRHRHSWA